MRSTCDSQIGQFGVPGILVSSGPGPGGGARPPWVGSGVNLGRVLRSASNASAGGVRGQPGSGPAVSISPKNVVLRNSLHEPASPIARDVPGEHGANHNWVEKLEVQVKHASVVGSFGWSTMIQDLIPRPDGRVDARHHGSRASRRGARPSCGCCRASRHRESPSGGPHPGCGVKVVG